MKKKNLFALGLMFMAAMALSFTSCSDDDDSDDTFVVTFMVKNDLGNDIDNAVITFNNVTNPAGDYVFEDVPTGSYNYSVQADGFLLAEGSVNVSADVDVTIDMEVVGIIGNWISEGENVAPLLLQFNIVKIIAEFDENGTYRVESYDPDDVMTELVGTYVRERSSVEGIWNITLLQSSPTSLTSEGIFQVIENGGAREMRYEVVQTDPSLGFSPPTAEGGFGSTGDGALGDSNIQHYVEITE